jgi:hypothetical protein
MALSPLPPQKYGGKFPGHLALLPPASLLSRHSQPLVLKVTLSDTEHLSICSGPWPHL